MRKTITGLIFVGLIIAFFPSDANARRLGRRVVVGVDCDSGTCIRPKPAPVVVPKPDVNVEVDVNKVNEIIRLKKELDELKKPEKAPAKKTIKPVMAIVVGLLMGAGAVVISRFKKIKQGSL